MDAIELRKALGHRAFWGRVGYAGNAFAPAVGTYRAVGAIPAWFGPVADTGRASAGRAPLANLYPLILAALYEAAFALEAGPLSTWWN